MWKLIVFKFFLDKMVYDITQVEWIRILNNSDSPGIPELAVLVAVDIKTIEKVRNKILNRLIDIDLIIGESGNSVDNHTMTLLFNKIDKDFSRALGKESDLKTYLEV